MIEGLIGEPDYTSLKGSDSLDAAAQQTLKSLAPGLALGVAEGKALMERVASDAEVPSGGSVEVGADGGIQIRLDFIVFTDPWYPSGYLACTSVLGKDSV